MVNLEQLLAETPEAVEGFHLALRFAQFGRRGETLGDRPSVHFAGQTEVGTVARLARQMTVAIGFSAAALNGRDGAAAEIPQLENPSQNLGALLFEGAERVEQGVPPIRTYRYVRMVPPKKENRQTFPLVSHTHTLLGACTTIARVLFCGGLPAKTGRKRAKG